MDEKALVIFSGGQDSTTCLAVAKAHYKEVHAITFDYGQRHEVEITCSEKIVKVMDIASHEVIKLGKILKGTSPLISDNKLGKYDSPEELPTGVEPTFVAGRNILFLTIASNRAHVLGITDIFTGVCQEDFAGYWDCRQDFIDEMQKAISQGIHGNNDEFTIHTPLMDLTKAESVELADRYLKDNFKAIMGMTHTCYDGTFGGCGKCHACVLRDRGFEEAGIDDPLWQIRKR